MRPLFPRWTNAAARATLFALVCLGVGVPLGLMIAMRLPQATGERRQISQPVSFDHRLHVQGFKIDCRYCHAQVERSSTAGMPPTVTCVACHSSAWINSSVFAPIRQSLATDSSLQWNRVHRLPDFVYFNHSIHVNKGVGCESCHGRVDQMPSMYQAASLSMQWCVNCHAAPEQHLRPVSEMTTMGWKPSASQAALRKELMVRYRVRRLTTCTTCHR